MATLRTVRTVQQTAKTWKAQIILANLLILPGIAACVYAWMILAEHIENPNLRIAFGDFIIEPERLPAALLVGGILLAAIGFLYRMLIRFLIWWNHG